MRLRHHALVSAITACLLLANGCAPEQNDQAEEANTSAPRAQIAKNYPFRWLPTPALDLESPDGTFVRAIVETEMLFFLLGSDVMAAAAPPGYREAAGQLFPNFDIQPFGEAGETTFFYAVEFPDDVTGWDSRPRTSEPAPSASADTGRAAVCTFTANDKREPHLRNVFTYRRSGSPPPGAQRGSSNQPINDVFGDWTGIEDYETIGNRRTCPAPPDGTYAVLTSPSPGWPGLIH